MNRVIVMRYILLFFLLTYFSGCYENTVNTNEDTIPPSIKSIFPPDSSENINVYTPIFAVFSEKIDAASAIKHNIKFTNSGREQNYSIVMKSDTLLIKPDSLLKYSTKYRVSITTGVKDIAGNPLKEPKEWHFVTMADTDTTKSDTTKGDTIAPEITATDPANGATGVSQNTAIAVTFSEPVLNVNAATFTVKADSNPVSGNIALNGLTATFTASDPYPYSAEVTVNLSSGITDTAGNDLTEYSFFFTVEDEPYEPFTLPVGYKIVRHDVDDNGNYYFGGNYPDGTYTDCFVGMFDSNGRLVWIKYINSSERDVFRAIKYHDGKIYYSYNRYTTGTDIKAYMAVKVAVDGSDYWSGDKLILEDEWVNDIKADMIYVYTVSTHNILKIDISDGSIVQKVYLSEVPKSIYLYNNNIYVAGGYFNPAYGNNDFFLRSYSMGLSENWVSYYNSPLRELGSWLTVNNNGIYLAGNSSDDHTNMAVLLRYDFSGNLTFDSTYVDLSAMYNIYPVRGIIHDLDGNIYMVHGPVKFNPNGSIIWDNHNWKEESGIVVFRNGILSISDGSNHITGFDPNSGAQIFP